MATAQIQYVATSVTVIISHCYTWCKNRSKIHPQFSVCVWKITI